MEKSLALLMLKLSMNIPKEINHPELEKYSIKDP
jgi:hypothetical protein